MYFPTWYLGKYPDNRIILTSYAAELAEGFSRKSRNLMAEVGQDIFGVTTAEDLWARDRWDIEGHRGGMVAAGIGGPITGRGANIAIIDDVIKNHEEANSPTYRQKVWDWYKTTLYTRLEPGGAIILVMTRWHEDDLAGRLLKEAENDGDQWVVLRLPATAEEGDVLGRRPGEALWPERFDEEELARIKRAVGSYVYAAMYQQKPQPASGNLFKRSWFRYFQEDGEFYILERPEGQHRVKKAACWIFQTVDPAATEKETSSYFVCSTWAVTPEKDLLLLDVFRERAETTKHKAVLKAQRDRWSPAFQGVENKTFGLNIIQEAKKEGAPIKPLEADSDKVARALPASARYEAGTVYHRMDAHWLEEYENELLAFPKGKWNDQVDTAAYAAKVVQTYAGRPAREQVRYPKKKSLASQANKW